MPYQIDYDPRKKGIRDRAAQDQGRIIQLITRLRQLRQLQAFEQIRLSGDTLTQTQLDAIDDFNRTNLILNAILVQAQGLQNDPSKTEADYVDVDAMALYNGTYTRPIWWTQQVWAKQTDFTQEAQTRQDADAALQTSVDAKFTLPSGGTTLQYLRGDGTLATFPTLFSGSYADLSNKPSLFSGSYSDLTSKPTLGTASAQNSSAFDAAGAAASAQAFSIQRANQTGTQLASTISDFSSAAIAAVTWSTLTGKPTFATVATTGTYADLTGKPTIPPAITLTTTGTSGGATFNTSTGALNIPNYANSGGTVTSVSLVMPTGLTVSGSPVSTSGTLTVTTALSGIVQASGGAFSAITVSAPLTFSSSTLAISAASGSAAGSMSSADFTKLSKLAARAFVATASATKSGSNTTETSIVPTGVGTLVIPSAVFDSAGYSFSFEASGVFTNVLTGIVTLKVKLGSQVTLSAAVSLPILSAKTWRATGSGTVRSGRVLYSSGSIEFDNGSSTDGAVFSQSSITVTAGNQTADFTAQWNLVLGGASITCDQMTLDISPSP